LFTVFRTYFSSHDVPSILGGEEGKIKEIRLPFDCIGGSPRRKMTGFLEILKIYLLYWLKNL